MKAGSRRQVSRMIGALCLLLSVSAYRQISLYFWPGDEMRAYLVFGVYAGLLIVWCISLRSRITQNSMRLYLTIESMIMLLWALVRLIQETYLYRYIFWMRYTGYMICVVVPVLALLNVYASLGLGRGDSYRMPAGWFLLWIPVAALSVMAMTDPWHHFLVYVVESEPQPNLYFHPYIGSYLVYAGCFILDGLRAAIIFRRNRLLKNKSWIQLLTPFIELVMVLVLSIPYILSSFWVKFELMEYSAGIFFIAAIVWELCILGRLVPVNIQYEEVFSTSSIAMQITDPSGVVIEKSCQATPLSSGQFQKLKEQGSLTGSHHEELHIYPIGEGYFIWQNDMQSIDAVMSHLRQNAEELTEHSQLLSQELRMRSEEAHILNQNRIYDELRKEVQPQLTRVRELIERSRAMMLQPPSGEAAEDEGAEEERRFRKICCLGTYIKRYSGLRLIWQEAGNLSADDLWIGFRDLLTGIEQMGTRTQLHWSLTSREAGKGDIFLFEALEAIIEAEDWRISQLTLSMEKAGQCRIMIDTERAEELSGKTWIKQIQDRAKAAGYRAEHRSVREGYELTLVPEESSE